MVGDAYQLPAIGAGNVLADVIASHRVPVFYLTDIFRQEQESGLIVDAHRVRQGKRPALIAPVSDPVPGSFYFIEAVGSREVASIIVALCRKEIPPRMDGIDPVQGIQVLTPMHRGDAGTLSLNHLLQQALNPAPGGGIDLNGTRFGIGDKVMHLKNNYEKEVFNGDIGRIAEIDRKNRLISVDYDGRRVEYDFSESDEIILAYAITVHKAQGSEYPVVVMPVTTRHYPMLQRNLIYTAMTRARHLAIFVGTVRALEIALENNRSVRRRTGLAARLAEIETPET
jgi:exodeoxyribonuclease V alpha subunit